MTIQINNRYAITEKAAEEYTDVILSVMFTNFTQDDGATTFQGQSFSFVVSALRRKKLKVPRMLPMLVMNSKLPF